MRVIDVEPQKLGARDEMSAVLIASTTSDLNRFREQRQQTLHNMEFRPRFSNGAIIPPAVAAKLFSGDEVLVTQGTLDFCGRLGRFVIKP